MKTSVPRSTAKLDLVYGLSELTPEEIAIVEGETR
jgi:hypothetical protein